MTTDTHPPGFVAPRAHHAAGNGIPDSPPPLRDLILRLERAASHLESLTGRCHQACEADRLQGKREGVLLALSYAREYQR
jgi:hypothetical protein